MAPEPLGIAQNRIGSGGAIRALRRAARRAQRAPWRPFGLPNYLANRVQQARIQAAQSGVNYSAARGVKQTQARPTALRTPHTAKVDA